MSAEAWRQSRTDVAPRSSAWQTQCMEQSPLALIPRAVAKAKTTAAPAGSLGVVGSVLTDRSSWCGDWGHD